MKKIALFVMCLALFGCHKNVLYPGDNGKTFTFNVGESFEIKLPENPSTGYKWRMITIPQSQMIISQLADQFGNSASNVVGAGGERVFRYQVTNPGTVDIYGFHTRPWETNSGTNPSVKYRIVVK